MRSAKVATMRQSEGGYCFDRVPPADQCSATSPTDRRNNPTADTNRPTPQTGRSTSPPPTATGSRDPRRAQPPLSTTQPPKPNERCEPRIAVLTKRKSRSGSSRHGTQLKWHQCFSCVIHDRLSLFGRACRCAFGLPSGSHGSKSEFRHSMLLLVGGLASKPLRKQEPL